MPGDERQVACAVAVEYSHDPTGVPIASAALSFHSGYCCSSSVDGSDCCSGSCSRS